jgi:hypothetical protein
MNVPWKTYECTMTVKITAEQAKAYREAQDREMARFRRIMDKKMWGESDTT